MLKSEIACVRVAEELPWKFGLEEAKLATTVWLPTLRELVENCAAPVESAADAAGVVLPSRKKLTVPLCVPATEDDTVAVNVTECPVTDGFELVVRSVDVGAALTASASAPEVLLRKFASPLYLAVRECVPAASAPPAAVNCATPPDRLPEPICAPPSKKVTVPVGTPPAAG
jgi:hypothetical protein